MKVVREIYFLVVEDDRSAATIAQMALEEGWARRGIQAKVAIASNGLQAIQYLENVSRLPDLIITDLKMPKLDGNRLIGLLKASVILRSIPVLVLSTSDDEDDKRRAYLGGCAGYFLKEEDYDKFLNDLQIVTDYWTLARLPDHDGA